MLVRIASKQGQPMKPCCTLIDADESSLRLTEIESRTWDELAHVKGEDTPDTYFSPKRARYDPEF